MNTAEEKVRREFDGSENIRTFRPKRNPSFTDYVISAVVLEATHYDPPKYVVQDILTVGLAILSAPPKIEVITPEKVDVR